MSRRKRTWANMKACAHSGFREHTIDMRFFFIPGLPGPPPGDAAADADRVRDMVCVLTSFSAPRSTLPRHVGYKYLDMVAWTPDGRYGLVQKLLYMYICTFTRSRNSMSTDPAIRRKKNKTFKNFEFKKKKLLKKKTGLNQLGTEKDS